MINGNVSIIREQIFLVKNILFHITGEKNMEKKENRSGQDRRSWKDRRKFNDPNYSGSERRSGVENRSGKDRRVIFLNSDFWNSDFSIL
jgi:hypothetical protein